MEDLAHKGSRDSEKEDTGRVLVGRKERVCSQSNSLTPTRWPSCIWDLRPQENKAEGRRRETVRAGPSCPWAMAQRVEVSEGTGSGSNEAGRSETRAAGRTSGGQAFRL